MAEINQKLASLFTTFSQNVIADETDQFVVIDKEEDLAGLPEPVRQSAATEAESRNMKGKWVINNSRSAVAPFLTYSERRELREKVWRMFVDRGDNGGKTDNNAIITEILNLRAERAKLLGYETHAHWRIENTMAKTPERAVELLERVWTPAVARARQEVKDMQALANKEKAKIRIEPWDYRFYAEKVRKQKYDLDENLIKPYMQLDKLRDAMFWVGGELFGLEFKQIRDVEVFHPDVTVWQVSDKAKGKAVGLFYFDPYARKGKRSGAWMSAYRVQERFDGDVIPIVSNNSNFMKGKPGEPVLISWDDATTLFHEFGHAVHGLLSDVRYPSLAGTAVFRDYVEFPSQLLEHWLSTPEVLQKFAVHHQTGEPIPEALVKRIERAATFNQGFDTVEFLGSAFIDMKIHLEGAKKIDPDAFERDTLASLGMPSEIVMRHRTPQFMHVFSSDSYSAGYYSYLWADVLTADGFEAFREAAGPYDKKVAESLRKNVLSVGNTIDPSEGYRQFRGRDARVEALMKKRGFPVKK
jgi:peptidyl-dipeptidase Dcp